MVEKLERRRLMSGDVSVRLEDGWLRVEGDAADNLVIVERSATDPSAVVVRGEEGTTLNGASDALTFAGAAADLWLRARMGHGDDRLSVLALDTANRVRISMGAGS